MSLKSDRNDPKDEFKNKASKNDLIEAIERARESEERFKLAMKASSDGLFDWNLKTNSIYYSPGWKKMLGYEDSELPNDFSVWEKLTNPEEVKKSWEQQQKLISGEIERFVVDFKMKHKNGHWVDIQSRAEAVFNDDGEAIRIIGTHNDITERKLTEKKLKDSQAYLSVIFNNTQDSQLLSQYCSNKSFKVVAANSSYINTANQLGLNLTQDMIIGKSLKELLLDVFSLPSEVYDYTFKHYQNAIENNQQVLDTESLVINGKPYHSATSYTPIFTTEDELSYVFYNSHDITKETEAIHSLKRSEERFALAVKGSNDAIWDWDNLDGDEYWWSDRYYELLGYNPGEVEVRISNWQKWMHPDDSSRVIELLNNHLNRNSPFKVEFRMRKKNGDYIWLFARGESVRDDEGKPVRMAGSVSDISERKNDEILLQRQTIEIENRNIDLKQANKDLLAAKERSEESDRLKTAFLSNMSHEIRTPMNGILGFAELLKKPNISIDEQKEYIQIIEKSGVRMLNIINDIIDISKIEAGLMELDIKESNVNEQMDYVYTFFKPEVEAKGLKLNMNNTLPSNEAVIFTDREKVFAIMINLVKNAVKYTAEGSIEFGYTKKDSQLEFYVKDTGSGIPEDRQDAIFKRFIQADITDKMAKQGTGLGLSISRSYVEMLGGKIRVESKQGLGSIFYFTLPYNTESETGNEIVGETPGTDYCSSDERRLKILIVEDDPVSDLVISIFVGQFSRQIIKAATGKEAIDACRSNPDIDIIFMDIKMPEMDGLEATRLIRQFNKDVVIIAQTAYGLSHDRVKALDAGCNDYIAKPIDKSLLISMIQKYAVKK